MAAEVWLPATFDGVEACRWCDAVPGWGAVKCRVEVGTTVWFGACTSCLFRHDNLVTAGDTR